MLILLPHGWTSETSGQVGEARPPKSPHIDDPISELPRTGKSIARNWEDGEQAVTASAFGVALVGSENILELVMMVAHHRECTTKPLNVGITCPFQKKFN